MTVTKKSAKVIFCPIIWFSKWYLQIFFIVPKEIKPQPLRFWSVTTLLSYNNQSGYATEESERIYEENLIDATQYQLIISPNFDWYKKTGEHPLCVIKSPVFSIILHFSFFTFDFSYHLIYSISFSSYNNRFSSKSILSGSK